MFIVLLVCISQRSHADAPDSTGTVSEQTSRQFVLLRNDRVLEGVVRVVGDTVVVQRGGGSELRLPGREVVGSRSTIEQLFELRQQWLPLRSGDTPTDRLLSEARWCIDQKLHRQAAERLMQVYETEPNHPVAKHLESRLRSYTQPPRVPTAFTGDTGIQEIGIQDIGIQDKGIQKVSYDDTNVDPLKVTDSKANQPIESTLHREVMQSWLLHAYTARVQPILLSRCAECHRDDRPGDHASSFLLTRPVHSARPSRRITEANLRETLQQCVPGDLTNSPLIKMARSPHGHSDPELAFQPFGKNEIGLLQTLESFVAELPSSIETQKEADRHSQAAPIGSAPIGSEPSGLASSDSVSLDSVPIHAMPIDTASKSNAKPKRLPVVERPLAAENFNRQTELIELFRRVTPSR